MRDNFPTCPICSGQSKPDFQAAEHKMYRCQSCGDVIVHPMPSEEYLANFYAKFHRAAQEGGWYDDVESRAQADFPAKAMLVFRLTGGKPGRLLDVGCGKGFFVKCCVDRGIDAQGIDLSQSGVSYAIGTLKVKATCGQLANAREQLGLFDAVTFWATIEHVPDPRAMLRDIFLCLKPGEYVFVDTGTGDDWLEHILPGRTQWYDPPQHLHVLSKKALRHSLESVGFQVIQVDTCFERSRGRRAARQMRNGLTACLLRLAAATGRLRQGTFGFTRFPMGHIMCAVARKPAE